MSEYDRAASIGVEVIYALPQRAWRCELRVPEDSTVADAIDCSGLTREIPGLSLHEGDVAIFGRTVTLGTRLRDGDRVELLRPLQCDPKQVRRERAARSAPRRR